MTVAEGSMHPCCGACRYWGHLPGMTWGVLICTNERCGWVGHPKLSADGQACGHFKPRDESDEVPDA